MSIERAARVFVCAWLIAAAGCGGGQDVAQATLQQAALNASSSPRVLTRVRVFPRAGFASRMVGGKIQGSNIGVSSGFVDLAPIPTAPADGTWTDVPVTGAGDFRYLRYLSPTNGFCNVAELELYSGTTRLTGTGFGSAGSWNNSGNTFVKALDGNTTTFFDAPTGSGAYVGLDIGASSLSLRVRYFPRPGYESRMIGGKIQGSNRSSSSGYVDLAPPISSAPPSGAWTELMASTGGFRYLRYLAPDNGFGNVAELELYDGATRLYGSAFGTSGASAGNSFDKALDGDTSTFFDATAPSGDYVGLDIAAITVPAGSSLVAIDTPARTYLDLVDVPPSGLWAPETSGWPTMAQWEHQTVRTGLRVLPFTPGGTPTPQQIIALLPQLALASRTIDITAAPYNAPVAPADARPAIQAALDDAAAIATPGAPVDVLVPPGVFDHSEVLVVKHDVRLRRWPEDSGGVLQATNPLASAVHLAGDRSAALFLVMQSSGTARTSTPWSANIWVGGGDNIITSVQNTVVVGNDVSTPASGHIFALGEIGGLWAFNYAHDGYADTFHHTGGSHHCQVVANRARESAAHGDDLYAFVSYNLDGDVVHHCTCIGNWGRDGTTRGLSVVGGGFISFERNDIDRTQAAGAYIAQENMSGNKWTYGSFDVRLIRNSIAHANLNAAHDGVLVYAATPQGADNSATFGFTWHRIQRVTIQGNQISDTAPGIALGFGIEVRSSADTGDVSGNTLARNRSPQLSISGTNYTQSNNTIIP
jgi:hypothetical protein